MYNTERDMLGAFTNGLPPLASPTWEQSEAGVNSFDNEYSAGMKVQELRARGGGLAALADNRPRHRQEDSTPLTGRGRMALLLFWALAAACAYFTFHFTQASLGNFTTMPIQFTAKSSAQQRESIEKSVPLLKPLFKDGVHVEQLYKHCKVRLCTKPDWAGFETMRHLAANPSTYENDVCKFLGASLGLPVLFEVEPIFAKSNALEGGCTLTNQAQVNSGILKHNILIWILASGVFLGGWMLIKKIIK